jgi:hypothetical protein
MSMPTSTPRTSVAADLCCFCGREVDHTAADRIRLSALWLADDVERDQSWAAHRACLTERMDEGVKGSGPFFGD